MFSKYDRIVAFEQFEVEIGSQRPDFVGIVSELFEILLIAVLIFGIGEILGTVLQKVIRCSNGFVEVVPAVVYKIDWRPTAVVEAFDVTGFPCVNRIVGCDIKHRIFYIGQSVANIAVDVGRILLYAAERRELIFHRMIFGFVELQKVATCNERHERYGEQIEYSFHRLDRIKK